MKILKLILEAALFISFIGFFAVMFINPGQWMGIFGSLFFILLPFNLILGRVMKQGKINIGKGGYFVLIFTMGIGLLLLYMSISAGDKNLVYDSTPLFMRDRPVCQQTRCEISFSIKENDIKNGQLAFVEIRVRPNQLLDTPQNLSAELIGPQVSLKVPLDKLIRETVAKRAVFTSVPRANQYTQQNFYTQELEQFNLKSGDYKLVIQTTDNKNLLDTVQYLRGLVYKIN